MTNVSYLISINPNQRPPIPSHHPQARVVIKRKVAVVAFDGNVSVPEEKLKQVMIMTQREVLILDSMMSIKPPWEECWRLSPFYGLVLLKN